MDFGGRNRSRHCKQNSVWMPFGARQRNLWYLELCPCQGGGFKMNQTSFIFTPSWGNDPIWRAYFSNGLVQPPTRFVFTCLFWVNPHFPLAGKEQTIYTCPCWASRFNLDSPLASLLALVHPTQNTENIYTHTREKPHKKETGNQQKRTHIGLYINFYDVFRVFVFWKSVVHLTSLHPPLKRWPGGKGPLEMLCCERFLSESILVGWWGWWVDVVVG